MDKGKFNPFQDKTNENLKDKGNEQVLEISSTGYGLESVSPENQEKLQSSQSENNHPSCGGL